MDDPGDIAQFIILFILLLLSAFFSSAETALTTVSKIRMRTLADSGNSQARRVLRITSDSGKMLSAILIGNNIVNLSASSLATALAISWFGSRGAGIATGILTFLILIFGEVSPKTLATIHADALSLKISGIISFLMKIMTPVIFIINRLSLLFLSVFGVRKNSSDNHMTEEELRTIVDVSQETGVIENSERDIIHNLFDFGDAEAKEVMIPRIDMVFIPIDSTYSDVLDIFREFKYTRIPVYEDNPDQVVGIINVKDLLLLENTEDFHIQELLREPYFTYEHKNTADLFLEMKKSSISLAIVLDEYGSTAGLITLEDLLEEIVGEIRDEYDADEEDDITKLSEREYMILGSANLGNVNDALGTDFTSEDYDTLGGFCLSLLNHMPQPDESISTDQNIILRIEQVDQNRIEKIHVLMPPEPESTE